MMMNLLAIGLGGALGALLRYGVSGFVQKLFTSLFPWGTLCVNLVGCFLLGFLFQIFQNVVVSLEWRSFLLIGFLGAFTTFSTYSLETVNLLEEGEIKIALINLFLQNFLGIGLALLRVLSGRWLFR